MLLPVICCRNGSNGEGALLFLCTVCPNVGEKCIFVCQTESKKAYEKILLPVAVGLSVNGRIVGR